MFSVLVSNSYMNTHTIATRTVLRTKQLSQMLSTKSYRCLNLNLVFNMMYSLNKPQKHNFNMQTKTRNFLNCLKSMWEVFSKASVEDAGGDLCSKHGVWVSGSWHRNMNANGPVSLISTHPSQNLSSYLFAVATSWFVGKAEGKVYIILPYHPILKPQVILLQ